MRSSKGFCFERKIIFTAREKSNNPFFTAEIRIENIVDFECGSRVNHYYIQPKYGAAGTAFGIGKFHERLKTAFCEILSRDSSGLNELINPPGRQHSTERSPSIENRKKLKN